MLLGSACPAQAPLPPGQAPPGSVVGALQFTGQVNVPENTLQNSVRLKPGEAFSAARLELDRRALLGMGFFRSVTAAHQTTEGQTRVSFRLVEWPKVAHIRVLGDTVVDRRTIQNVISTQLGQVLNVPQLQDDIRAIERLYRERGYVARISEKILEGAVSSGILRFEILELQIADVQVEGGSPVLREKARALLAEVPPALYRPERVTLDQRRLMRLPGVRGAVSRVDIVAPGKVRVRWLLNPPANTPETDMPR